MNDLYIVYARKNAQIIDVEKKLICTKKVITIFNLVGNCNNYCVVIIIHGDINFRRYRVTMNLNVQCQKYKCYIGL